MVVKLNEQEYQWGEAMDAIIFTAIATRLVKTTKQHPAFKMGLINASAKVIREPKTREERRALSHVDRIVFFMKKYMPGRIPLIHNMYRKARMDTNFLRSTARGLSLRFNKYYDLKTGFFHPDNIS